MAENIHDEIYKEFCECNPEYAKTAQDYRPWGRTSIIVWFEFKGSHAYKIKRCAPYRFVMQPLSKEDIDKKFGLNK